MDIWYSAVENGLITKMEAVQSVILRTIINVFPVHQEDVRKESTQESKKPSPCGKKSNEDLVDVK